MSDITLTKERFDDVQETEDTCVPGATGNIKPVELPVEEELPASVALVVK